MKDVMKDVNCFVKNIYIPKSAKEVVIVLTKD